MRKPEFLKEGGVIGFVAPSFGCNISPYREAFDNARAKFSDMGYKLFLGPNCYRGDGVGISTSPENAAKELMDAVTGEACDVLISCGGGELMCEILPFMDFDALKKSPAKWFSGYSDNTNFTFLYTTLCDTMSLYAPCASTYGMEVWHESLYDALGVLKGDVKRVHDYELFELESLKSAENPLASYNVTEKTRLVSDADKFKVRGRLLGGCLDCLVTLSGTSFDGVREFSKRYGEDGIIWYLESCDLNPFGVRRALWQLKHSGWFEGAKAFLIGRPYHYGENMFGLDMYEAFSEPLKELGVPVVMDCDIGHVAPMMPMVNGALSEVAFESGRLLIDYLDLED